MATYNISSWTELAAMDISGGHSFNLTRDLLREDADYPATWTPIGNTGTFAESGGNIHTFDGKGFTIYDLNVNVTGDYGAGLFGKITAIEIKNLNLVNATIVRNNATARGAGILIGYAQSLNYITNCNIQGTVTSRTVAGGVIGEGGLGDTRNSTIDVVVTTTTGGYAGGFVGYAFSNTMTATDCNIKAMVTGTGDYCGLVSGGGRGGALRSVITGRVVTTGDYVGVSGSIGNGFLNDNIIQNAYIAGRDKVGGLFGLDQVIGQGNVVRNSIILGRDEVGGIGGRTTNGLTDDRVENCIIIGRTKVGGIFGYSDSRYSTVGCIVKNCKIYSGDYAGGIAGDGGRGRSITDCLVINTEIFGEQYVGGLIGNVLKPLSGSNAISSSCVDNSSVYGTYRVGGLAGYVGPNVTVSNCITSAIIKQSGRYSQVLKIQITPDEIGGAIGKNEGTLSNIAWYTKQPEYSNAIGSPFKSSLTTEGLNLDNMSEVYDENHSIYSTFSTTYWLLNSVGLPVFRDDCNFWSGTGSINDNDNWSRDLIENDVVVFESGNDCDIDTEFRCDKFIIKGYTGTITQTAQLSANGFQINSGEFTCDNKKGIDFNAKIIKLIGGTYDR